MSAADRETVSEESEDDGAGESREEMIYRRKYQMLLERCEVLQQDNERLVHRIQQVFKYTRQVRKERKFLMDRLDSYGDNWRQGITQYYYENTQTNKPNSKLKYHPHSGEKRVKKSTNIGRKSLKDKSDSDLSVRKHPKESVPKSLNSIRLCKKLLQPFQLNLKSQVIINQQFILLFSEETKKLLMYNYNVNFKM